MHRPSDKCCTITVHQTIQKQTPYVLSAAPIGANNSSNCSVQKQHVTLFSCITTTSHQWVWLKDCVLQSVQLCFTFLLLFFLILGFSSSSSCSSSSLWKWLQGSGDSPIRTRYNKTTRCRSDMKVLCELSGNVRYYSGFCRWWKMLQSFTSRLTTTTRPRNRKHWRRRSASSTLAWEFTF